MSPPAAAAAAVTAGATAPSSGPVLFMKTIQSNAIRTLFEVLKEIVHDVMLEIDSTGVRLQAIDSAKCAVVYLKLRAEAFEEFVCRGEHRLGVNMTNVFKLVKTSGSHDTVTFYMGSAADTELGIRIDNAEKNSVTDYKLNLLDLNEDRMQIPDERFDSVITMPSVFLQRMCRDMLNLSDVVTLRSEGSRLVISCAGDFARQETVIGEADAGMSFATRPGGRAVEGRFSLKYLALFCKASSLSNTVEIFLKNAFPLILKYNVASLGELRFLVAAHQD